MTQKRTSSNFIPSTRKAPVKNVSEILEKTLKAYHLKQKIVDYSIFPEWEEIVGSKIAKVAVPDKIIRRKILQIRVLDAVWAQEISFKKDELIEKINNFGQGAIIEDIKFVIGNPNNFKNK